MFEKLANFPDLVPGNKNHYMSFKEIYGKETNEKHRPSLKSKSNNNTTNSNDLQLKPTQQYVRNVGQCVLCIKCNRPRVLYSKCKVKQEMIRKLHSFLETVDYSCGTTFVDLTDLSFAINSKARENLNTNREDIFVNAKLSCQQEMERTYYSTKCFMAVCFNCGIADIEIPSSNDTYPYCNECEIGPGFKRKRGKGLKFGGEEYQKKKAKKA
ncbi:unnamed protein product [Rhizophagus irregularis]|uniref:Uncharacterized protein n=1 Tax=Rhizophagus irregularis TaxID=588596 RepID=A0A915ZJZ5_9GLOM|nr:unnamed protein product [Rhizophagus irregularis]